MRDWDDSGSGSSVPWWVEGSVAPSTWPLWLQGPLLPSWHYWAPGILLRLWLAALPSTGFQTSVGIPGINSLLERKEDIGRTNSVD